MPGLVKFSANTVWPVALEEMRNYLKINTTADDTLIQHILIPASTIYMENNTGLTLASRQFVQSLDSFPFYPYSKEPYGTLYGIGAMSLYFGYGPIQPTPFPPFGLNTGERLPFQIDLLASPCTKVDHIDYVGGDGQKHTIYPGKDFIADLMSTIPRVMPLPGSVWPQCTIGANNVRIYFTAGMVNYDPFNSPPDDVPYVDDIVASPPDPPDQIIEQKYVNAVPQDLKIGIIMMCSHLYFNRDTVVSGNAVTMPHGLDNIIGLNKVYDFSIGLR
jgi:hypothetical protein